MEAAKELQQFVTELAGRRGCELGHPQEWLQKELNGEEFPGLAVGPVPDVRNLLPVAPEDWGGEVVPNSGLTLFADAAWWVPVSLDLPQKSQVRRAEFPLQVAYVARARLSLHPTKATRVRNTL